MKFASIFGITIVTILITLYDWPKMKKSAKKEKLVFVFLIMMGWGLAVLLVYFPDLPGPTQLVEFVFQPFSHFLK